MEATLCIFQRATQHFFAFFSVYFLTETILRQTIFILLKLAHPELGVLYLCEIKFTRNIIRSDIIDEVKNKMARLSTPKNMSIIPVLIHVGDVHDEVIDSQFFGKIIDIARLLDE